MIDQVDSFLMMYGFEAPELHPNDQIGFRSSSIGLACIFAVLMIGSVFEF